MASTWQDLINADDQNTRLVLDRHLLAGEDDESSIDTRYVRKDGVPIWLHISLSLVRTVDGVPDYFAVTAQDITERKAIEALTDTALSNLALDDLLRELLGRLVAVMGVDNVAILLLDENGQTLTVRAARGSKEEGIGRVHIPVGQGFSGRIAASREPLIVNDLATFEGVDPILREHLRAVVGVPLLVEDRAGGHLIGQPMSQLVGVIQVGSAAPRRFTEADVHLLQRVAERVARAIHRALLYSAEQDAHQQAEAARARAVVSETEAADRAARLHTILETMADGVAVYDAEGRSVQMNRAYRELYALESGPAGFESLPAIDRARLLHLRDASTGAPLPPERAPDARALAGEVVSGPNADLHLQAFDGRELDVNASAVPMREPDGRFVGAVSVVRDITERNRLEREREDARTNELAARETSRRMEAFLATAAHDLRSPLGAIVGYLALAESASEKLEAAVREACPELTSKVAVVRDREKESIQGADRLTRLLTRLFDMAAIRADRLELRRAICDLGVLAREQVEALDMQAPGRIVRLRVPEDGTPILVYADADRIGEVIMNYLANALKYSPTDQPVDILVEKRKGRARVAVRDWGPGIPKDECPRVWDLFHRAPGVTEQGGARGCSLGLGLYICKAIVEAHGGRVGVESAVGQGSAFWFTLPLAREATE